ncbi:zinc finger protein 436-like [Toxorhynchites rutilus septentrionalis]|uniref:zinc finger protein 436-like n=1 Tax=Toxorhynchites rutilus septentrionalis TaxID=329112 RepID=UPI0024786810|nr:zinc finger protein 436-like [Toxorhynchites rutilus septentrionalis]
MEFMNSEHICRCCLTNAGKFSPLFEIYNDYYLPKVINVCTGLSIIQSDGLPDILCEICLVKLITAYETRRLFIRSNDQLKERLSKLKQSEQEIITELNSTVAKCVTAPAVDSSLLISVENILDEGPITTWDSELNIHIKQFQDSASEMTANIENCLDELVNEKYEKLEKDGYSFPINAAVDLPHESNTGVLEAYVDESKFSNTILEEQDDMTDFPPFSDYSESSDDTEGQDEEVQSVVNRVEETPQKCHICGKMYRNSRLLQRHIQYHNTNKMDCPICSRSFTHKSNLKRHLSSHKPSGDGFPCPKCSRMFEEGTQLYDHLKLHKNSSESSRSYTLHCDRCELETTSLAGFVAHMARDHGIPKEQVKAFRCHICTLRFVSKQGMLRHIQSVHENQKPVQGNNSKKFLCTECGKCFQRLRHLEEHANSHAGIRPFVCECGLSFTQQSGLNLHIRAKHKNQKSYICKICRKSFSQATHLKHHELIHSNRKEHECTVCKHRFRVKSNLVAHMRIHRKHPYCCSECGREFTQSASLEQHMATDHERC